MSATNETTEPTRAVAAPDGPSAARRRAVQPGRVARGRRRDPRRRDRRGRRRRLRALVEVLSAATITVTGSGTVQGTPDTVSFTVGVHTTRVTAALALAANNTRVQALESTLMANGVTTKDLQTSNLNIYEQTNQYGTITGFSVDDTLNVTVMNADGTSRGISAKAGRIIDAAATATGNGIDFGGVSFSISNESNYLAIARARAVQNAMTEASQVARGANTSVSEHRAHHRPGVELAASVAVPVRLHRRHRAPRASRSRSGASP